MAAHGLMPFAGYVLTGGSSRRMGRDKALLAVDGIPMAGRVAAALAAAGATSVTCVGGDVPALKVIGLPTIADDHPGEGPLGGIITALRQGEGDVAVIAPCDLLDPQPAAFLSLVAALGSDADVAVPVSGGRRHPVPAAWRRTAVALLQAAFADGERSPTAVLDGLRVVEVALEVPDADAPSDLPQGPG